MSANPPLIAGAEPKVYPARTRVDTGENALFSRVATYLLPLGTGAVYLLFPTKNYYWDGISFASTIENSPGLSSTLIHPHHLLYNVFGYLLYSVAQASGWPIRAVQLLQMANSIVSVLCGLLLFRFLKHTLRSNWVAAVTFVAFSFSASWWKYSTDADSYIPSVFFLLVCLNLLLAVEKLRPFLLAFAHTASMCMHQLAVFFFPAIIAGILLRSEYTWSKRFRLALQYSAVASLTTLGINYYSFHWVTGRFGLGDFARWLTSYVQGPDSYSFSFNLLSNLGYTLRGQARLFFEGRINWTKGLLSFPVILLIAVLVGLVAVLAFQFFTALPKLRLRLRLSTLVDDQFKPLAIVCVVWLISYLLFLFFWYPYFTPYRLFYLAPALILMGVYLAQKERAENRTLKLNAVMFVAAMAISNFVFFILPLTHAEKFPPLSFALEMNQTLSAKSVVYYAQPNADNQLVRYFNPHTTWKLLKATDGGSLDGELNEVYRTEGTVWLETTAISQLESSIEGKAWLAAHSMPNCCKELNEGSYRLKLVQVFPPSSTAKLNSPCVVMAYLHEDTFK